MKRVPETTTLLFGGLLKNRGFGVKSGMLVRKPSLNTSGDVPVAATEDAGPPEGPSGRSSPPLSPSPAPRSATADKGEYLPARQQTKSSLSAFKRTKSLASKDAGASTSNTKSALQRIRSTPASASAFAAPLPPATAGASSSTSGPGMPTNSALAKSKPSFLSSVREEGQVPEGERQLFGGLRFRALGDANGPKLAQAIRLRGGKLVERGGDEVDFVVVRLLRCVLFVWLELLVRMWRANCRHKI